MNKRVALVLVVVVLLAVAGWFILQSRQDTGSTSTPAAARIGVVLPLSGDAAEWGTTMKQGIDLALETINENRGERPRVELLYEDDRGLPADGARATEKLITVNSVGGLVGVANSSVALAMIPLIDRYEIPFVSGGASSPDLSGASRYFFRTWPSDVFEAVGMARYAHGQLGINRLSVLYINNAYGEGLRKPFRAEFEQLGGTVVSQETFLQEATDFRTQLTRIKAASPEAVYLVGNPREMARCLRQAREQGLDIQFLSTSAMLEQVVLEIAGEAADGVLFTDASFDTGSKFPPTREFVDSFRREYGEEPGMLTATGYDALRVLVTALDEAGWQAEGAVRYLASLSDFPGAAGPISFDARGDVHRPVRITEIRSGEFLKKEDQLSLR